MNAYERYKCLKQQGCILRIEAAENSFRYSEGFRYKCVKYL